MTAALVAVALIWATVGINPVCAVAGYVIGRAV
jgi:hypothetical protein